MALPERYQIERIASGHDNIFALPFDQLSPPLFQGYSSRATDRIQWNSQEELILQSDRTGEFKVGLPFVVFTFQVLTLEEIAFLRAMGPEVTIYVENEESVTWGFYNGTLLITPNTSNRTTSEKSNQVVRVIDLIASTLP